MNLMIDSILVMLVCFVLGALIAWLLAAALYPSRKDLRASAERQGAEGGGAANDVHETSKLSGSRR